jgi:hypothetical protein
MQRSIDKMKVLIAFLLLLASALVLASPLPSECDCSCDSNAILSHFRKYGEMVGAGVESRLSNAAKTLENIRLNPFAHSRPLAQSRPFVEYEPNNDMADDDEDEDDDDEDDGDYEPAPTTIDCGDHPMTTSELMRLAGLQRAGATLPGSMTLGLPSAPTVGFEDDEERKIKYRCATPKAEYSVGWTYNVGWTVWSIMVVLFLMIGLFFVAVAIVEIWDILWAR